MSRVRIIPAEMAHVYALAANMRRDDADEIESAGVDVRKAVRDAFRNGFMRRAAFVDGDIAAMWGLGGVLLSDVGVPWLLTTAAAERVPVSFLRIAREQMAAMLAVKPVLENYVAARYTRAVRLLEVLGFTLDPPSPFGPMGAPFRRFEMRR